MIDMAPRKLHAASFTLPSLAENGWAPTVGVALAKSEAWGTRLWKKLDRTAPRSRKCGET
jgi:hypothetical protein